MMHNAVACFIDYLRAAWPVKCECRRITRTGGLPLSDKAAELSADLTRAAQRGELPVTIFRRRPELNVVGR